MGTYYAQLIWGESGIVHFERAFYSGDCTPAETSENAVRWCVQQLDHPGCEVTRARVIDGHGDLVWEESR